MAQFEKMIPFLIYWETGVRDTSLDNKKLFEKARLRGIVNDPADAGGATLVGVTIGTYREYFRRKGKDDTSDVAFPELSFDTWKDIMKSMFWDRWRADEIYDQRVAEFLVDWVWTSGVYGITVPQKSLGVKVDGIVGEKTLKAVNSRNPTGLFAQFKQERIAYIDHICRRRPANERFRTGWLRRINAI